MKVLYRTSKTKFSVSAFFIFAMRINSTADCRELLKIVQIIHKLNLQGVIPDSAAGLTVVDGYCVGQRGGSNTGDMKDRGVQVGRLTNYKPIRVPTFLSDQKKQMTYRIEHNGS